MSIAANSARLPEILSEVLRCRQVWDDQGNLLPLDSNISEDEAVLLNAAVADLKPARSLEIGLAKGISTVAILGALARNGAGHHVVMDPYQQNYGNAGVELVRRAGLESIWEFHPKFAEEVVPAMASIQFAFIDASHLFDLTLAEFVMVDKKLEVGGVVGFHDFWMPSQQSLFRYIVRNRSYEVWSPEGFGSGPSPNRGGWKAALRRVLRCLPKSEQIFAPDFLHPWADERLGNLVLLRKQADDDRHWTFHRRF